MGKKSKPAATIAASDGSTGRPKPSSRYGGGTSRFNTRPGSSPSSFLFDWNPALREPFFDVREGWAAAAARAIDSIQNSGFFAGAIEQACGHMIGAGLALDATPDPALFGGNQADAAAWGHVAELLFNVWANDPWACDLGARYTLGQIQDQAVRQMYATGEIVGTLPTVKRPGNQLALKVNLVPSMRLVQGSVVAGTFYQDQGVILGQHMEPVGYTFWNSAVVFGNLQQEIVAARTASGRPVVMHIFSGDPGAIRGITPLAPGLKVVRKIEQLADATLTAALLQTIFAATVESSAPTAEVLRALDTTDEQDLDGAQPGDFDRFMNSRFEWYKSTKIDLGNFGKIAHMYPGEELKLNGTQHPNQNYESFHTNLLREFSRCIGISYESTGNNYSQATYSSMQHASADLWPLNMKRRAFFPARMMQMIYECFLEESIAIGLIEFPGGLGNYLSNRAGAANASWRGPPKPIADDLKTAKAQQILRAEGLVSRAQQCAAYGNDWREVNLQRAAEMEDDERLGLPPLPTIGGGGQSAGAQEADDAGGDASGTADSKD